MKAGDNPSYYNDRVFKGKEDLFDNHKAKSNKRYKEWQSSHETNSREY